MKKVPKTLRTVIVTFLVTVLLMLKLFDSYLQGNNTFFPRLLKVGKIIDSTYVSDFDKEECEENAINAVLAGIGDKYAVYYDEENAKKTLDYIDGQYYGVGIEVFANTQKNKIEVISAYEDSPADRAGIKGGDLIVKLDGKEYTAKTISDAVAYLKEKAKGKNDTVDITIERSEKLLEFKVRREKINIYKVKSEIIDDICYIRYSGFADSSFKEVMGIVDSLDKKKVSGIVIDVRDNPGGEFGSALDMCDMFLDDGIIMYTMDKEGERKDYSAKKGANNLPLAIITNGYSASASEIFAGSMQARKRAVIVGEKTYGKGVSQTVRYINPLDKSEGALKLTTHKNYTPDGKWLNESVIPDIEVKAEKPQKDIRSDAAFIAAKDSLKKGK